MKREIKHAFCAIFIFQTRSRQSTKVPEYQSPKPFILQGLKAQKQVWYFGTLIFKLLSLYIQFFLLFFYFFIYYFIKNRVPKYQNTEKGSKTLINQAFFWYSSWYFAFCVKYQSTKTATAALLYM